MKKKIQNLEIKSVFKPLINTYLILKLKKKTEKKKREINTLL